MNNFDEYRMSQFQNNINSASAAARYNNMPMPEIETYKKVVQQTQQLQEQLIENKKQTEVLQEAKLLTKENVECTKQIAECTLKNQESSEKQHITSRNLSWVAIGIALLSLIYGCVSSNNTDKLYKQQLKKQDEIIELLKKKPIKQVIKSPKVNYKTPNK